MTRRRTGWLTGAGIALLLVAAFVWWFLFSEFKAIDRCLDGGGRLGGSGTCEYEFRSE